MQFLKCVKVALLVSGAVFTVTSLPAARLANERIDIQFNRDQFFSGEVRDFAGAYLSIAGLVSASLGVASFSLAAWRQTGSRLAATQVTIKELESLVQQREQQLQAAQLTPAKLQQGGLDQFLDDNFPLTAAPAFQQQAPAAQQTAVATTPRVQQPVPAMNRYAPRPVQQRQQLSVAQASQLQAVQTQLQQQSRARSQQANPPAAPRRQDVSRSTGGFTVINPYQVQAAPQPSRQAHVGAQRSMA